MSGPGPAPPPARRPFLSATWRYLVMLNYEVDPDVLRPLAPAGTTLDLWHGRALASVVGFRFLDTRVAGLAIPFHRNFDEVNLRFYVRRDVAADDVRHGVSFVRELVPRTAIALVARLAYNEPYRAMPMRSITPPGLVESPGRVSYAWRSHGRWQSLAATARGAPATPAPESEAAFITEHHWGYTRQRDGATVEYEVRHPRWRVWSAGDAALDADVAGLYGPQFVGALTGAPSSALVAEGSPVAVYPPRRIGGVDSARGRQRNA